MLTGDGGCFSSVVCPVPSPNGEWNVQNFIFLQFSSLAAIDADSWSMGISKYNTKS